MSVLGTVDYCHLLDDCIPSLRLKGHPLCAHEEDVLLLNIVEFAEQQGAHQERQAEAQKRVQEDLAGLQDLRAQLREAERDRDEASAAASKFEADLQALSQAYGDLEMHAHSLESQHNAATSTPGDLAKLFP